MDPFLLSDYVHRLCVLLHKNIARGSDLGRIRYNHSAHQ